jgi:hypothetical protein
MQLHASAQAAARDIAERDVTTVLACEAEINTVGIVGPRRRMRCGGYSRSLPLGQTLIIKKPAAERSAAGSSSGFCPSGLAARKTVSSS